MADWKRLTHELVVDPRGRGWSAMSDADADTAINAEINIEVETITTGELYDAIDRAEFNALDPAEQAEIDRILSLNVLDVRPGSKVRTYMTVTFAGGTATRTAMTALVQPEASSLALQIFGKPTTPAIIAQARA